MFRSFITRAYGATDQKQLLNDKKNFNIYSELLHQGLRTEIDDDFSNFTQPSVLFHILDSSVEHPTDLPFAED